ncbi:MAG: FAD-dependent oxidoreductase [Flavobacteriales bacterium]|nr:FAD-dependent oxidoreductase [Flavobacteriales bacterium]MCB9449312.1 FAD-dependent oxidoreductase [Flavobacteriales bacterium]
MDNPTHQPLHCVAIVGGAVSGAEAAHQLSQRGIEVVVFDQATLPYGKIEDGLPKWHVKLRDKEEAAINEKIGHPLVRFVPNTRLGQDIGFTDLVQNWGFSAVLLANGAWKDRPLQIPGIERFDGTGLYYQNALSHWFNHYHEPGYNGKTFEIRDNAVIIGGGLASIDMAKLVMMELVQKALAERSIKTDTLELERGIDKVLEKHDLKFEDLGLKGCTLFYRRRKIDMPLTPSPTDTPEQLEKAQSVRVKVLENARSKFFFHFRECCVPVGLTEDNGHLTGIVFRETKPDGDRVVELEGSDFTFPTSLVISSIGSIPEPIPGVPMDGQTYRIADPQCCRIDGFEHVFALGNAVTGRGNIKESFQHGRQISLRVMDDFLAGSSDDYEDVFRIKSNQANIGVDHLISFLDTSTAISPEAYQALSEKVKVRQQSVGYHGNYNQWVEEHLPVRLEKLTGHE